MNMKILLKVPLKKNMQLPVRHAGTPENVYMDRSENTIINALVNPDKSDIIFGSNLDYMV